MDEYVYLYGGPADDTRGYVDENAARIAVEVTLPATIAALGTMRPVSLYAVYERNGSSFNFARVEWGRSPEDAVVVHELSGRY